MKIDGKEKQIDKHFLSTDIDKLIKSQRKEENTTNNAIRGGGGREGQKLEVTKTKSTMAKFRGQCQNVGMEHDVSMSPSLP